MYLISTCYGAGYLELSIVSFFASYLIFEFRKDWSIGFSSFLNSAVDG